jgi:hypothetical protein
MQRLQDGCRPQCAQHAFVLSSLVGNCIHCSPARLGSREMVGVTSHEGCREVESERECLCHDQVEAVPAAYH